MTSALDIVKIIVGKRWPLIVAIFVLEIAVVIAVSNAPFFPSELATYEKQYNTTAVILSQPAQGQVLGIFANNFRVALVELVPVFGLAILGLSLYETARIVEVIAIVKSVPISVTIANLFILPSTWLELPAYAIAATESIYLVYSVYVGSKKGWWMFSKELRFFVATILLIGIDLIVAATFEVTEIQLEGSSQPLLALLTWLPFALVFAGVVKFWRTARRDAPAIEQRDAEENAWRAAFSQNAEQGAPQSPEEKRTAGSPTSGEGGATA